MADLTKIIEKLDACTTRELGELVPMLEEKWGIECPRQSDNVPPPPPIEEQTEFNVVLVDCESGKRVKVIGEVRRILGLGLRESKDVVDNLPATIAEYVSKAQAEELKLRLGEVGGTVEIR